jgi:flagellum-specific ATP synthase
MSTYSDMEELIRLGAYRAGSNAEVDRAIALNPALEAFLTQQKDEATPLDQSFAALDRLLNGGAET